MASVVASLANLPGCKLWDHSDDSLEASLTMEQETLAGGGNTGPPLNFDTNQFNSLQQVLLQAFKQCTMFKQVRLV